MPKFTNKVLNLQVVHIHSHTFGSGNETR